MRLPDRPKQDRFAVYNSMQPPYEYRPYPKMLQNLDGTTTIVNNEEEHRKVSGKNFDPATLVGSKTGDAAPAQSSMPFQPVVEIPDTAKNRRGAKLRNLDGQEIISVAPGPEPEMQVQEAG